MNIVLNLFLLLKHRFSLFVSGFEGWTHLDLKFIKLKFKKTKRYHKRTLKQILIIKVQNDNKIGYLYM